MKKQLPLGLVTAVGIAASNPAFAVSDVYLKGGIGWAQNESETATVGDLGTPPDRVMFESDDSITYHLGVGYRLAEWLDMELSLNHVDRFDLSGPYVNDGTPSGEIGRTEVDTTSVMILGLVNLSAILDAS